MHAARPWVLILALALCGCRAAVGEIAKSETPRETSPSVAASEVESIVAGNTRFALDLYQQLTERDGNLFFSPYSISVALAMTYAGARGETASEMRGAVHFTLPQDDLHPAFNALELELAERGEGAEGRHGEPFRLHTANALWGQDGYTFLPDFLDRLARNYGAGMRLLDFEAAPETSRAEINDWVAEQTEDKIQDLIPRGVIDPLTRLVLTNAIYFDAAWESKFKERSTRPGPFTTLEGDEVQVDMMHQSHQFPYTEGDGYQAIELPYDGGELAMLIVLPARDGFDRYQASLDADALDDIISGLELTRARLTMPKFRFESAFRLKETLSAMGMPTAFTPGEADFSGMDGTTDLFIQEAIHKALVRVDEEGTEAAAATAVVMGITALPPGDEVEMTIDHPFIFLVRDRATGAVLFLGRVLDPTA